MYIPSDPLSNMDIAVKDGRVLRGLHLGLAHLWSPGHGGRDGSAAGPL
jgi:hypothetical protein